MVITLKEGDFILPYTEINITIELFCSILLFILISSVIVKKQKIKSDYLFLALLVFTLLMVFGDMCAWICENRAGTCFHVMASFGGFLSYFGSPFTYIAFLGYIYADVTHKKLYGIEMTGIGLVYVLSFGVMAVIVLNLFNGMIYRIDENNIFLWGEWRFFPNLIGILVNLLFLLLIWFGQNHMKRKERFWVSLYVVLPFVGILIGIFMPDLVPAFPTFAFSLLILYVNIQQEQEKQLLQKELELNESQVRIMLSQIQPHFLYNSLLGIKQLCDTEPKLASEALEHFSYYLRGNLYSISDLRLIPFEKEMEHVQDYLYLEKMRFGKRLNIEWNINFMDFMLPPLTLQPIVENAVRHGITKKDEDGLLTICCTESKNEIHITVKDNGVGFDQNAPLDQSRSHVGIENVRKRVEVQCGGSLNIQSKVGVGTEVVITLPRGDTL